MTNLERIFELFESHVPRICREHIQHARVYLNNGAEIYSKRVRPLDVDESRKFLDSLESSFSAIIATPHSRFKLSHAQIDLDLDQLKKNFSTKAMGEIVNDVKILRSYLRNVLNSENITSYQQIDEFFDLVQSLFENMLRE